MSEKLYKVKFEVEFGGHKYVRATNIEEARQKLQDEFVEEDGAIKMPLPFTTPLSDSFVITDATLQE
jgi:hypothetical protein